MTQIYNDILVSVYGTLRKGDYNHHFLQNATLVADNCWTNGRLYDTGCGYPALVPHPTERVIGEVYVVDEATLNQLNELEGYNVEGEDNLYERTIQKVFDNRSNSSHLLEAYVYIFTNEKAGDLPLIKCGDWMEQK
ncbi:branched-chain alpha-keto acid dehydrogenase [Caldalkalibacillus thermarum]|uniref:gamma-glutamylcyclotransferase family protein n=1 Tax=Caldalkalibacillus thermarum TaxID=296745 RepID=UPI00166B9719|nr:gamma-glutamylcyclotransferase family protein [Caldalkalibacillus thermarum]GGK35235.1 branched-chain alpha-keto acid dehydrogenase [Caldalkalibacillus thermarum]